MFLEDQYESYIEDIRDVFERASTICENTADDLDTLAWDYDELLTAIEDGEDYDQDRVDALVERFRNKIDDGADSARSQGSELDYYDCYEAIKEVVIEELSRSGYSDFASLL